MLEYEEASKITGREWDRQWKVGCSFWAEWARLDVGRRGHHLVGGIVSDFFSFLVFPIISMYYYYSPFSKNF